VFGDDLFELGREAVHAAQDDHVVIACSNAVQAAHGTCGAWQNAGEIVGAVANNRQSFFGQGGDDKLTIFTIRKRLESFWVHDFWVEVVFPYGQAVFGLHTFLSFARAHDLREAVDIDVIKSESYFTYVAYVFRPCLGTEDDYAQCSVSHIHAVSLHAIQQHQHLGRDAYHDIWLEDLHKLDLSISMTTRSWNSGSSQFFDARV